MKTIICCSCFIVCVFAIPQRGRPISKAQNPSVIINRNSWKAATVNHASDYQQNLSDEQVRKYLSMLKNHDRKGPLQKEDTVVSHVLEVLNPVEVKQNFLTKQLTTTTEQPTTTIQQTTTTEQLTTEEATTEQLTTEEATTENPNNLPKSGEVELLVENIVYSGHMIHWSAREQYLAISDIWGQKYLRFEEIPPATTTTDEAVPYDIKILEVDKDVVYLIQPHLKTEGHYPLLIPVDDYGALTEYEDDFIFGFGDILHVGHWNMESSYTNFSNIEWHNTPKANMPMDKFLVPSPAWIDPSGKMLIGSKDLRKFEKVVTNTRFTKLPNTFELFGTLDSLSKISCEPNGMAWSTDNTTLYFSDGHTANITKCVYDMYKADASDCSTILNMKEVLGETAVPQGLATDENGHVWVAVAKVDGKGAVLEIEPDSADIISTIDLEDEDLVDLVFGGEDLDFLYILSKSNLYKLTGLGVVGMHVPDFVWNPDEKKRSISLQNSS